MFIERSLSEPVKSTQEHNLGSAKSLALLVSIIHLTVYDRLVGANDSGADRFGGRGRWSHASAGASRLYLPLPEPRPRRARLQHLASGRRRAPRLRLPTHRSLHALRPQDPQRPRELQRSQVHRLRHVHHLCYLDRFRSHLLR